MRKCALALACLVLASSHLDAQETRPPRPTKPSKIPVMPSQPNELYVPYWTLEPGWHTGIELRNNLAKADLTVTPSLRTTAGVEFSLSPVTVKPNEIAMVDLHAEVLKAAPHLADKSGSVGSVVLRYSSPSVHNLYAGSMVHLEGKPIAYHFDAMQSDPTFDGNTSRESIWWLPTTGTEGHLIVTNASSKPSISTLTLFAASGKSIQKRVSLGPRQMRRFSMRELVTEAGFQEKSGGLRIQVERGSESIYAAQVVFDETTGFSALLRMFERNPSEKPGQVTLRAPMMALSAPDPALVMPQGTILRPQVFLRNASPDPLKVAAKLRWRDGEQSGTLALGNFDLSPGASRTVEVFKLQDEGKIPGTASWGTIYLDYPGRYGDLVAIAASYEAEGRYGLQTPFNDLMAGRWVGSKWYSDPLHNSIITVGNGSDQATTANLTLHYNRGKDIYEVEQKLAPGEQIWLDVTKTIRNQVPDKEGRTIPQEVEFGSYSIRDKENGVMPTLFEGKLTIDKKFGHASYGCGNCCTCTNPWMDPNPFSAPTGGGWWNNVWGFGGCDQEPCELSYYVDSWGSNNTPVASVDGVGYGQGVAPGNATISAFLPVPSYYFKCPFQQQQVNSPGTVRPMITGGNTVWWFNGETPSGYATSITLTSSGGSSTTWSVTAGSGKVSLSAASGSSISVSSSGTSFSAATGDISLVATANGVSSSPFSITTRKPNSLIFVSNSHECDETFGYSNFVKFSIRDQLTQQLTTTVDYNEAWLYPPGFADNYSGNNWSGSSFFGNPPVSFNGTTDSQYLLVDWISGPNRTISGLTPVPYPVCVGDSTPVHNIVRYWRIGSTTTGLGVLVQTDRQWRYVNQGFITVP